VQLQTRAGRVRCGRCMHVFDGFQALAVEQANVVSEPVRFEPEALENAAVEAGSPPPVPATAPPTPPIGVSTVEILETPKPPEAPLSERMRGFAASRLTPLKARLTEKYLRKPSPEITRIALAVLLGVVLAAQMAYAFRSQLAARYPSIKGALIATCDLFGCAVTLPQRPDLVKIEASDVHLIDASKPSLIQLTATIRSYAGYDLAYPALDLVLTNANEHALARRIFLPEEYLDATRDARAGIPPRAEITVALDIDTGDLNAAGFRLDLLPAP
jgi:uncharacterized protein DUF3426